MEQYYKWATYRRKMLDDLQNKYRYLYKGIVLDIGGQNRGKFKKPREEVKRWIFADINKEYNPEIVLDVSNMTQIDSNSIDVVNAIELFEHVLEIETGLKECYRILKDDGLLIISTPFLFRIHSDPNDYQRWTYMKWRRELENIGFNIEKLIVMGKFYTHLAELHKINLRSIEKKHSMWGKLLRIIFVPFLNFLVTLDSRNNVKDDKVLSSFHCGYFIITRKNK